jgi:DNA-binding response OmpR family regulator
MKKVLILDNSDLVRICLRRVLEEEGFKVIEAIDFGDASSKLEIGRFDIVVLDFSYSQLILEQNIEAYIIAFTDNYSDYLSKEATKYGVNAFLKKPIIFAEFKKVIGNVF